LIFGLSTKAHLNLMTNNKTDDMEKLLAKQANHQFENQCSSMQSSFLAFCKTHFDLKLLSDVVVQVEDCPMTLLTEQTYNDFGYCKLFLVLLIVW